MADIDPTVPRTVHALKVDSFMRLKAVDVLLEPTGLVQVRGRNEQGKSSLIDSIVAALRGRKGAVERPIRDGAHGAEVEIDFGDLTVFKTWTPDAAGDGKAKLRVTARDGVELRRPQGVLDALVGEFADPVEFLRMKPEDQVRTVLRVVGIEEDLDRLEASVQVAFNARRDLRRDLDRASKTVESLAADGPPEQAAVEPPERTVEELVDDLRAARDHAALLQSALARRNSCETEGRRLAGRKEVLLGELQKIEEQIEAERAAYRAADAEARDLGEAPDPGPIEEQIRRHEAADEARIARRALDEKRAERDGLRKEFQAAEAAVESAREELREFLAGAPFPVDGMGYDPEKRALLMKGVPISQASQAERIEVASAVAMSGEPSIRIVFIRDASLLDSEHLARVDEMSKARGFQCIAEIVDEDPAGAGIYIEDGEVVE